MKDTDRAKEIDAERHGEGANERETERGRGRARNQSTGSFGLYLHATIIVTAGK